MKVFLFYLLSLTALDIGVAAIYMALIEKVPVSWLYYHYFLRKPVNWSILFILFLWTYLLYTQSGFFPFWTILPLLISILAIILTYKMHQSNAFRAIDFPEMSGDPNSLPIENDMEIAVVEYEGVTKCYPLDYVIHHHIINDQFGEKIVSLTYCAMCRTVIPFDITDIGPLFVGSFKNANMIVADRKTKTFFQQATFKSVIGKLHPHELTMIPFQLLSWGEVKEVIQNPQIAHVTKKDFRDFQLPIPGIWKKIIATESTPGLTAKNKDKTFPARTRVIGIIDEESEKLVFLRKEVLSKKLIINEENNFFLVGSGKTVNGFRLIYDESKLDIIIEGKQILDKTSGSKWNLLGKYISGDIKYDLKPVAISDEYWFSWKRFHGDSQLLHVNSISK